MYVTNTPDGNALLRNNGDGTFTNVAAALGVTVGRIGWGTAFLDYDNDGDDDLYVVNWTFSGGPNGGNVFFENRGGTFAAVSDDLGVGDPSPSFGLTVGDYNNDGYVDMFVNNQSDDGSFRSVFYESVPLANHWVKIKTVGTVSNRDGIGAKIRIAAAGNQIKDVRSGSSYLSQLSPEVEFGLGAATTISSITITWPSGTVDVFNNVAADKFYEAHEGESALRLVSTVSVALFEARAVAGGNVELLWEVSSDQTIDGFRVYRRDPGGGEEKLTTTDLAPTAQSYVDDSVQPAKTYEYRLGIVLRDGTEKSSQRIAYVAPVLETILGQNQPNPFVHPSSPSTTIQFNLANAGHVALDVYDALGRHVITLINGPRVVGPQSASWDGTDSAGHRVGSGVYFYRLKTAGETLGRKMILIK
jgi:hypothetical protein